MEDSIDLRWYVYALARQRVRLVAFVLAGILVGAVVSLILPPTYKAAALVSVAQPQSSLRLDGVTNSAPLPLRAYPELALSEAVLAPLFQQTRAILPADTNTVAKLRKTLKAEQASDASLLQLTASARDPETAAQIANVWAKEFAALAGQLYAQDQANLADYQQQLSDAKSQFTQAAVDLATFQSGNQVNMLNVQLTSQQNILGDYLNRQYRLGLIQQDCRELQTRLATLDANAPATRADDLALLSLISRVYGADITAGVPLQLQLNSGEPLTGGTVRDQLKLAADILQTAGSRSAEIGTQITVLRPSILDLQGKLAAAQVQEQQLTVARNLAQAHYTTLSSKVDDARIAAQASASIVQVASPAAIPTQRDGLSVLVSALLGGMLGLVLGVALTFLGQWRRELASGPEAKVVTAAAEVQRS